MPRLFLWVKFSFAFWLRLLALPLFSFLLGSFSKLVFRVPLIGLGVRVVVIGEIKGAPWERLLRSAPASVLPLAGVGVFFTFEKTFS